MAEASRFDSKARGGGEWTARPRRIAALAGLLGLVLMPRAALAELDLSRAGVSRLDNGLTVIVLEDHSLPVVSTQMIYKSGARDETAGKTGLAHFLEHLAFRASKNFPDALNTRAIYDVGGEWHGYTWIDQTAYYATVPRADLDLMLRIEADRMARITIDPAALAAEKGAVITEMHSYENDPASVLLDAATAFALQVHPYRNNTIGYEGDVRALTVADATDYYRRHYRPGNAVLAIVGDISPDEALKAVQLRFGDIPAGEPAARVSAVEPPQTGERRFRLIGPVTRRYFKWVQPAPAASSPDFAGFLVLQQLASGGSGANFQHNDWGGPAVPGAALHGVSEDLTTWFVPAADPYIFTISGSIAPDASEAALEAEIERRLAGLQEAPPAAEALRAAQAEVARQLAFDVQTTEDAAHQLAFYEGIGAYDALVGLDARVRGVSAADVQRIARAYLDPHRRTIGWYEPGVADTRAGLGAGRPAPAAERAPRPPSTGPMPAPLVDRLSGGLPVIVQRSSLSPTVVVKLVLSAPVQGGAEDVPLIGEGELTRAVMASDLDAAISGLAADLAAAKPAAAAAPSEDPTARLEQLFVARARAGAPPRVARPVLAVVSGDVDTQAALASLQAAFGKRAPEPAPKAAAIARPGAAATQAARQVVRIDRVLSQASIGYIVAAPPPGAPDALAWRMLLYILSHDYEGRLGRAAIGESGLVYHIYSTYRADGGSGWITLSSGVDPEKSDAMEAMIRAQLDRLVTDPPTDTEIAAARQHLLGRDVSAAQSNEEIADRLASQVVELGGLRSHAALRAALDHVGRGELIAAARRFGKGTIVRVDVASARGQ